MIGRSDIASWRTDGLESAPVDLLASLAGVLSTRAPMGSLGSGGVTAPGGGRAIVSLDGSSGYCARLEPAWPMPTASSSAAGSALRTNDVLGFIGILRDFMTWTRNRMHKVPSVGSSLELCRLVGRMPTQKTLPRSARRGPSLRQPARSRPCQRYFEPPCFAAFAHFRV